MSVDDKNRWVNSVWLNGPPLLVAAFYSATLVRDRYCLISLYGEGRFVEVATALLMAAAGVLALVGARRWREGEGRRNWFYVGLGVVLLLAALDEVGWGATLFDFEPPQFFVDNNVQGETTLHNFVAQRFQFVFFLPLVAYGVLLPPLARREPLAGLRRRGWLGVAPPAMVPAFVVASLFALALPPLRLRFPDAEALSGGNEVAELMIAVGLVVALAATVHALFVGTEAGRRRQGRVWLAAGALGALLMGGGALNSVARQCDFDGYRALVDGLEAGRAADEAIIFVYIGGPWDAQTALHSRARQGEGFYVLPDADSGETVARILDEYRVLNVLYFHGWGNDEDLVEQTFIENTAPLSSAWHANVRLERYVVPSADDAEGMAAVEARFGEAIRLTGFRRVPEGAVTPGSDVEVLLRWEADGTPGVSYQVFVHAYGEDGNPFAQHDGIPDVAQSPTDEWEAGDEVLDRHAMLVPEDVAAGTYQLAVGIYDPATGERLPVTLADGSVSDRVFLPPLTVR